jgi:hypothetical protein
MTSNLYVKIHLSGKIFHTLWPGDLLVRVLLTSFSPFGFRGSFKFGIGGKRVIKHLLEAIWRRRKLSLWCCLYGCGLVALLNDEFTFANAFSIS